MEHHPRHQGRSAYTLAKLLTLSLNLLTNFSLLPLQAASAVGLLAAVTGLGTGGFYLVQALLKNIAVPGYASIIVAILTLGGLQLLALGIIGEYIGRMHINVNRKPQYTVREVVVCGDDDSPRTRGVNQPPSAERAAGDTELSELSDKPPGGVG